MIQYRFMVRPVFGEILPCFEPLDSREEGLRVVPGQDEIGLSGIRELPRVRCEVARVLARDAAETKARRHGIALSNRLVVQLLGPGLRVHPKPTECDAQTVLRRCRAPDGTRAAASR